MKAHVSVRIRRPLPSDCLFLGYRRSLLCLQMVFANAREGGIPLGEAKHSHLLLFTCHKVLRLESPRVFSLIFRFTLSLTHVSKYGKVAWKGIALGLEGL